jgi:pimeloyl-ACP methyl ester carboxylesterase
MLSPKTIKAGKVRVEFVEVGSGPTDLLLLHGNFATWRWWAPALARLPEGVRAFAPTMRGCVGTVATSGGYELAQLARDVEHFASALGLQRFHLVGHSLGGAIALQYALDQPGRLTALDLVSPAPGDGLESMLAQETAAGRMLRTLNPERALDRAALLTMLRLGRDLGTNRRYLRRMLRNLMPGVDEAAVDLERLVSDAAEMDPHAIVSLYRALARWDVRDRRASLQVPTRILAGARDVLVPLPALAELARAIPGAVLEVKPQGGHSPMLEQPEVFGAWLADGLRAASLAPARRRDLPGKVAAWLSAPRAPASLVEVLPPEPPRPGLWARVGLTLSRLWGWLLGRHAPPALTRGEAPEGSQPPGK